MSFSGNVKEELAGQLTGARHCQISELAAIISMCGSIIVDIRSRYKIKIHSENHAVARKCFTLIEKTFNIISDVSVRRNKENNSVFYTVAVKNHEDALRILQATKLVEEGHEGFEEIDIVSPMVVQQMCCKRAFLRGAFLAAGSMSDPNKSYHFEIVCSSPKMAQQITELIKGFSIEAKTVIRKRSYVVYLKEGAQIVDMLGIMEAHIGLMELENVRILKDMRNTVNRKVNCETANINKTVSAAVKQLEDIEFIKEERGLDALPEGLEEMAIVRLSHPSATLKELGELLNPPVGKSGVNHRLRKIGEIADKLRKDREEFSDDRNTSSNKK